MRDVHRVGCRGFCGACGVDGVAVEKETIVTRLALSIRLYLATKKIEQKELAKAWDCSESTVTRFLAESAMPQPMTMLKVFAWMLEDER